MYIQYYMYTKAPIVNYREVTSAGRSTWPRESAEWRCFESHLRQLRLPLMTCVWSS